MGIDENHGNNGTDGDDGSGAADSVGEPPPRDSHEAHYSHPSHNSHSANPPERLLQSRDYKTLLSFQKAEVVYDITFRFAHKFLSKGDRTVDQMIQSARSGKKNILEGSKAGLTSSETEIKLTNVGRASLEELLDDYCDFLRARDLKIWEKDCKQARFVRMLGRTTPQTYEIYRQHVETRSAEIVANIAICLIHQTNYLIDRQLLRLEKDFVEQGGLRERMTRVRLEHKKSQSSTVSHESHSSRISQQQPRKPKAQP